jgi:hypothetical protein
MEGMFIKSLSHLNKIGELCQIKEQDILWQEEIVAYKHTSHSSMFKNVSLIDFDRLIWAFEAFEVKSLVMSFKSPNYKYLRKVHTIIHTFQQMSAFTVTTNSP